MEIRNEIIQGDSLEVLKEMPGGVVDCVVTSPPYWGLRDYGAAGQLGLEPTIKEYIDNMVEVFREVRRVLKDSGTAWVNMGDAYNSDASNQNGEFLDGKIRGGNREMGRHKKGKTGLKPKDLIGQPWRLALDLQQPYEHVQIKNRIDRAWAAGLVDGEGCITILCCTSSHGSGDSYPPVLQVRMCDILPLQKLYDITGYGKTSPKQEPPSQVGQRPSYQWRLNARKAVNIIAEIYPYLLVKKKQAIIAWNHQMIRESYNVKRGITIPTKALEKQKYCYALIRQANTGAQIDIPSWMKEPEIKIESGWYLRSDCIWAKPNPMPESVTDRPTKSFEHVFLLSKQQRYFYDADAVREDGQTYTRKAGGYHNRNGNNASRFAGKGGFGDSDVTTTGRNLRDVWTIPTQAFPGAHFATFPEKLVEPCIRAGTSKMGNCAECGKPWVRVVEKTFEKTGPEKEKISDAEWQQGWEGVPRGSNSTITTGWKRTCTCTTTEIVSPIVLDPFSGSGTVALVAKKLNRDFLGIELNEEYAEMSRKRLYDKMALFV